MLGIDQAKTVFRQTPNSEDVMATGAMTSGGYMLKDSSVRKANNSQRKTMYMVVNCGNASKSISMLHPMVHGASRDVHADYKSEGHADVYRVHF